MGAYLDPPLKRLRWGSRSDQGALYILPRAHTDHVSYDFLVPYDMTMCLRCGVLLEYSVERCSDKKHLLLHFDREGKNHLPEHDIRGGSSPNDVIGLD